MEFTLKELISLVGITRAQANQWMKLGVFEPSRKKGTGRGSSRNLFTLVDCYQAVVFKNLTDGGSGLGREVAIEMMRAIDKELFPLFVAASLVSGGNLYKFAFFEKISADDGFLKSIDIIGGDPSKESVLKSMVANDLVDVAPANAFLAFFKTGDQTLSLPVLVDEKFPLFSFSSWGDVADLMNLSDSSYIINFGQLSRSLDVKLMHNHAKMLHEILDVIHETRCRKGDKGIVSTKEIFEKILLVIG